MYGSIYVCGWVDEDGLTDYDVCMYEDGLVACWMYGWMD